VVERRDPSPVVSSSPHYGWPHPAQRRVTACLQPAPASDVVPPVLLGQSADSRWYRVVSMPHLELGGCWAGPLGFPVRRSGELSRISFMPDSRRLTSEKQIVRASDFAGERRSDFVKDRQVHGDRAGPLPEVWTRSRDAPSVNMSSSHDVAVSDGKVPLLSVPSPFNTITLKCITVESSSFLFLWKT
jgi:hypothetical protein